MSALPSTSIFDLPPVVDSICYYLDQTVDPKDYLINRTFYNSIRRHVWRRLEFKDTHDDDAICEEHKRVLLANSQWIQDLTVSKISAPLVCLTEPSSRCTNLEYLDCDLEHESSLYTASLAKLLTLNTKIKNLTFKSLDEDPQNFDWGRPSDIDGLRQVISVLPHLTSLRFISVETTGRIGPLDLDLFLSALPQSLESLHLRELHRYDGGIDEALYLPPEQSLCWPSTFPNITELCFDEFDQYDLLPIIEPLLQRCPRLQDLTLPTIHGYDLRFIAEVLGESCTNLRSLTISGSVEEEDLLAVVDAIPALASLDLPIDVDTTAYFVPHLIAKWSNTLSSVSLGAGVIVQSSDIQLLLTSCPHLETFWMCAYGGAERPWTISPYYSPLNLSDLAQSEWTCTELKALFILFHDERVEQDTLEQHLQQEDRTRELIKKAYAQLGKLKRLETLRLGWGHPFREGVSGDSLAIHKPGPLVHMDFSMASGLTLMKGISSLRTLSLDGMARISVGNEELEWIQQTWPSVQIDGLDQSSSDWLQVQRFNLSVQG
ncbi:hypothetical protein BGZ70_000055 [Mortierella alpina]|uniref:F-box domain-containing protein n=1 Tax=Mortierella alpina TaxID=64518 RepID=A0A9P6IYT8_MORAP|nr:hypothetical protein BGZ70_000055 [Mortierella alpina]